MDDTDIPDPILKQVPLVKNPAFQPPKPITLNTNYGKLIPTLSTSSIPPKITLSEDDLKSWQEEINQLKATVTSTEASTDKDVQKYKEWVQMQQVRVAPGFYALDGVMQPNKKEVPEPEIVDKEVNELDKVFGNTGI